MMMMMTTTILTLDAAEHCRRNRTDDDDVLFSFQFNTQLTIYFICRHFHSFIITVLAVSPSLCREYAAYSYWSIHCLHVFMHLPISQLCRVYLVFVFPRQSQQKQFLFLFCWENATKSVEKSKKWRNKYFFKMITDRRRRCDKRWRWRLYRWRQYCTGVIICKKMMKSQIKCMRG